MICLPCVAAVFRSWMVEGPDKKRLLDKATCDRVLDQERMASAKDYVEGMPPVALDPSEQDEVSSWR
jgi:hypothetical protein